MTSEAKSINCTHCHSPIPEGRGGKFNKPKYCSSGCARMASYYRKTAEERSEMNARYNQRRHEVHLLPRVRSLIRTAKGITPGSSLARYLVVTTLNHAYRDWRMAHALQYQKARDALATLAGGHRQLEWFEEQLFQMKAETI